MLFSFSGHRPRRVAVTAVGLAALLCGALSGCSGGDAGSTSKDSFVELAATPAVTLTQTQGALKLQATYANGVLQGTACVDNTLNINLSLHVGGELGSTARTERMAPKDSACYGTASHAGFMLPVTAEQFRDLQRAGAKLVATPEQGAPLELALQGPVPPPARLQVLTSTAQDIEGVFCTADGPPELRGAHGQAPLVAGVSEATSTLERCARAQRFAFSASAVTEWRHSRGVLSDEPVWLWSGGARGHGQPVQASIMTAPKVKLGLTVLETPVTMELVNAPWVKLDAAINLGDEFRHPENYTAADIGRIQGRDAVQFRARGMQEWMVLHLVQAKQRLHPQAAQMVEDYKRAYRAESGGMDPQYVYVIDEPFWIGADVMTPEDVGAIGDTIRQLVQLYRAAFPNAKLVTTFGPSMVAVPEVRDEALRVLPLFDIVSYDPYVVYDMLPAILYHRGAKAANDSGRCPAEPYERVDAYLSRCASEDLLKLKPTLQLGFVSQAFVVRDSADTLTSAHKADELRRHWRAMSAQAYRYRTQSFAIAPFGWRFSDAAQANEPALVPGSALSQAPALQAELIESLGR